MQINRENDIYTVAEGHDWFWEKFANGSWEPETFKIFDAFLDREKIFVDIGAWIGPTTLYAASRAKQVFAFEPDPIAYRSLVQNLELNRIENVVPYPIAVADSWKGINFGKRILYGDSMSSELWGTSGGAQVPAVSLEAIVIDLMPGFIKIDIEGGEKTIFDRSILALGEIQPTIHLSLHTQWHRDDLEGFKTSIMEGLEMYPYFYDENLNRIELKDAFNPEMFNSIVASFKKL